MDMRKVFAIALAFMVTGIVADARKVSGSVVSGEEKLAGVIVTDGTVFTTTNKKGKFSFDIKDDAEFVYIVTPKGYVADWSTGVPAFYQEAAGRDKFIFDLIRTDASGDYSIIAVSDPQTKDEKQFAQFAGAPMADLCETAGKLDGAVAGIVLGDICWDYLDLLEDYKKEILRTGVPFYPVVGNHDHDVEAKGDLNSTAVYRKSMGPENYAFFLGDDVVIVIDNIIYDTRNKYQEGYAPHVLSWVKGLESLIPDSAGLYIAQHGTMRLWFENNSKIIGSSDLLDIVRGHEVIFISGHTHIYNNMDYEAGISEHNVASICGAWWDTYYCTDGVPSGYKVYTHKDGRLEWYYKPIGKDKDYQVEIYKPGQAPLHPNSIVANVWDWDPEWTVEWYEDGKSMGKLEPVTGLSPEYTREVKAVFGGRMVPSFKLPRENWHYFAATPSQYAKVVTIAVTSRFGKTWVYDVDMSDYVDVQADMAAAKNSVDEVKHALDMGVNTVVISMNDDVAHTGELIDLLENYTKEKGYSPVRYNIEINTEAGQGRPTYDKVVTECCKLLHSKYLGDRLVVRSSDAQALNYMHEKYPEFAISYIVDAEDKDFDTYMAKLKFTPIWLSPHNDMTDETLVQKCHEKGMKIAPWAVDAPEDIERMLDLKVDALISTSPDKVLQQTRGYVFAKH